MENGEGMNRRAFLKGTALLGAVRSGSRPVDFPDFTRGAWKTAKPVDIDGVDLAKMGLA